jgi:nitroimidazol reductase NimA-like FMN-containing flavoprotein (pyridoxamine 5'-phosphate oxidase superfamily)
MDNKAHKQRIIAELKAVGMTAYGTMKMETDRLPSIIHPDEHIGGVVYGRTTGEKIGSAMLIATDKRIIFLDVKPFFVTFDEVSYDVVAGIQDTNAGPFAGIILHTRVRDYGLRFVNKRCASTFVEYIESHIELSKNQDIKDVQNEVWKSNSREQKLVNPDDNTQGLIQSQIEAVLSTIDREGNVHGSVIHYAYIDELFYFVSKTKDAKIDHLSVHDQVAITIHETHSLQQIQISGLAEQESDKAVVSKVFRKISEPKNYTEGNHLPPILNMKKGDFVVIRITPMSIKYHDYSKSSW